jgi:uncharacterized membrane protein YesL
MQDILHALLQLLPLNTDALGLSLATGIATGLVLILKALFSFARQWAQKTPSTIDDKIVNEAEDAFKEKSKNL